MQYRNNLINIVFRHKKGFLPREFSRLARFFIVGISGTLLDFGILYLLKTYTLIPLLVANTISYSTGIVNNFTLNRYWAFADKKNKSVFEQFAKFLIVNLVALILNNLIVIFAEYPVRILLGKPQTAYLYAKVLATVIVFIWNYLANRLWTFK